jgi:hypothetical protein
MNRMSRLSWRMSPAADAEWELNEDQTSRLVTQLTDSLTSNLTDGFEQIHPSRHEVCVRTCTAKHAVQWVAPVISVRCLLSALDIGTPDPSGLVTIQIGLRRGGSGMLRWESPLVALQRAEGFISLQVGSDDCDLSVWRLPPLVTQTSIVLLVTQAIAYAVAVGADSAHSAALADSAAYTAATSALQAQIDRVSSGGEPWTMSERLEKLARIQRVADIAEHKRLHGESLSELEMSAVEAFAVARSELYSQDNDSQTTRSSY